MWIGLCSLSGAETPRLLCGGVAPDRLVAAGQVQLHTGFLRELTVDGSRLVVECRGVRAFPVLGRGVRGGLLPCNLPHGLCQCKMSSARYPLAVSNEHPIPCSDRPLPPQWTFTFTIAKHRAQ